MTLEVTDMQERTLITCSSSHDIIKATLEVNVGDIILGGEQDAPSAILYQLTSQGVLGINQNT